MTDDTKRLIAELEAAYDLEEGFLGLLRGGHLDSLERDRFLGLLQSIDLEPADAIDRRLVGLLWYVPLFMQWQLDRLDDEEQALLRAAIDQVTNQLERILGVP
jgi:hypothetical protein